MRVGLGTKNRWKFSQEKRGTKGARHRLVSRTSLERTDSEGSGGSWGAPHIPSMKHLKHWGCCGPSGIAADGKRALPELTHLPRAARSW